MRLKKSIQIRTILALMFFIALFSACKKENMCDCIKRTGAITVQRREVSGFDQIFVYDNLNVFITQAPTFEVVVEAGKNVRGMIETKVVDGVLLIENNNRCNWARSYNTPFNVYIKMPVIKYITSDGTGKITGTNTFISDKFDVQIKNSGDIELTVDNSKITSHMHGAGNLILHGRTYEHACDIGGTAYLKCQDLQTNFTWLHTFTTGICYITATDSLWCKIDKIGDVECYGHPSKIDKTTTDTGQLYLR